ncbi:MAG: VOC family protein [Pyrinomonadaceae bacterium]
MRVTELRPMLWTEDLHKTVAFYTETLGFTANEVNHDWGWASLSLDDVSLMFTVPLKFDGTEEHPAPEKISFSGSLYFNTDDVDAMWGQLKDITTICYGIENFEHGMREFAIYDNNGYMLQFGQEISE